MGSQPRHTRGLQTVRRSGVGAACVLCAAPREVPLVLRVRVLPSSPPASTPHIPAFFTQSHALHIVVVIDPRAVLEGRADEVASVTLRLPPALMPKLSTGVNQLGDFDDPMDECASSLLQRRSWRVAEGVRSCNYAGGTVLQPSFQPSPPIPPYPPQTPLKRERPNPPQNNDQQGSSASRVRSSSTGWSASRAPSPASPA